MGDKSVGVLRGVGPTKIGGGRGPSLDESGSPAVCDSLNERSFEFCKFIVSACESDSGAWAWVSCVVCWGQIKLVESFLRLAPATTMGECQ